MFDSSYTFGLVFVLRCGVCLQPPSSNEFLDCLLVFIQANKLFVVSFRSSCFPKKWRNLLINYCTSRSGSTKQYYSYTFDVGVNITKTSRKCLEDISDEKTDSTTTSTD